MKKALLLKCSILQYDVERGNVLAECWLRMSNARPCPVFMGPSQRFHRHMSGPHALLGKERRPLIGCQWIVILAGLSVRSV